MKMWSTHYVRHGDKVSFEFLLGGIETWMELTSVPRVGCV